MPTNAVDIESWAQDPNPIQELVCVQIYGDSVPQGGLLLAAHDPITPQWIQYVLRCGDFVGASVPGDVLVILRAYPWLLEDFIDAYDTGRMHDVLTDAKVIDYATDGYCNKYSLAEQVHRTFGHALDKDTDVRLRYGELRGWPVHLYPPEFVRYAMDDARWTHNLRLAQVRSGYLDGVTAVHHAGHMALYSSSLIGITVDQEQVKRVSAKVDAQIEKLKSVVVESGLARFDGVRRDDKGSYWTTVARQRYGPFSSLIEAGAVAERLKPGSFHVAQKKAQELLAEIDPGCKRTGKSKNPALDKDSLDQAKIPDGHPLDAYRKLKAAAALKSTRIDPLSGPVVWTRYDEMKATGRTGSKAWPRSNPRYLLSTNLQNQPQKGGYRECLVARDGCSFIICDYSTIELVAWAQLVLYLFGSSVMANALIAGRCLHSDLAATTLGIPTESFDRSIPEHEAARTEAKGPNFGYIGGLGARGYVDYTFNKSGRRITLEYAEQQKAAWEQQWNPDPQRYFAYIRGLPKGHKGLLICRHPITGRTRMAGYTNTSNNGYQELAACAAKLAGWELWKATQRGQMRGRSVLFVHDEWVVETPDEHVEHTRKFVSDTMVRAGKVYFPDLPVKAPTVVSKVYQK